MSADQATAFELLFTNIVLLCVVLLLAILIRRL